MAYEKIQQKLIQLFKNRINTRSQSIIWVHYHTMYGFNNVVVLHYCNFNGDLEIMTTLICLGNIFMRHIVSNIFALIISSQAQLKIKFCGTWLAFIYEQE